ncbi:hypothetical protein Nepgr_017983 [Nepenthes gracilis]|uniref:Uncharacterized protein n=1 Tax=Nepenthes gracilis TaxID=150966 RepID=A0AAD3STA8_NEPGR|nr:hypothetical protein Nepgr_017983 [Nepenthes gracilis]
MDTFAIRDDADVVCYWSLSPVDIADMQIWHFYSLTGWQGGAFRLLRSPFPGSLVCALARSTVLAVWANVDVWVQPLSGPAHMDDQLLILPETEYLNVGFLPNSWFGPLLTWTKRSFWAIWLPCLQAPASGVTVKWLQVGQFGTTWKVGYAGHTEPSLTRTWVGQFDYLCDLEV